ncbi:class I SAM-dependent methyltransferase [Geodermatophilus sp. SYSU D00697]
MADAPMMWPPGHYYSPVPDTAEVRAREEQVFAAPRHLPGIDLQEDEQLRLVHRLQAHVRAQPFSDRPTAGLRYHFDNEYFSYGDGVVYYGMLRLLEPRHVVEVGSGYSSALLLDINERFLGGDVRCSFVEPHPERLLQLLRPTDRERVELITSPVQDVDLELFTGLRSGDVLFIDSSHVGKTASDVNRLLFDVLPALAPGVFVHVHDILYPFEYPKDWVYGGRGWNEAYLLRAFLMYNDAFRIRLFNSFLARFHWHLMASALPPWDRNPGGSIWLERTER